MARKPATRKPKAKAKATKPKAKRQPLRLNIGAGEKTLKGYTTIDLKNGKNAYPLAGIKDGSIADIYCSHLLEHFGHREVSKVLKHWVSKLEPGGRIRIAVPDFNEVAKRYRAGEPIATQLYIMGSHTDASDVHHCVFDSESLAELMADTGLVRIGRWEGFNNDCACLPISLNLQGYKPTNEMTTCENTVAVLSAPRYGAILHQQVAARAFMMAHVPYNMGQGAYWHQVLSKQIEQAIAEPDNEFVFTCDYDTIFDYDAVIEMYRLMQAYPEADAITSVQSKRGAETALMGMSDAEGKPRTQVRSTEFHRNLTKISTAHFGLTLFRSSTLRAFPKPWMVATPNDDGEWEEGRTDADIDFWKKWRAIGNTLFVANKVPVGHMEEIITWPSQAEESFAPVMQRATDYRKQGIPAKVVR
jgi:hypothetical protein